MNEGILELFKNPETFSQLSFGDRLIGSLYVILLGMGIVFTALVILMVTTLLMSRILRSFRKEAQPRPAQPAAAPPVDPSGVRSVSPTSGSVADDTDPEAHGELIAVIAAAVAASMNQSVSNIVVSRVRRVPETAPSWNLRGRYESMNNR